MIELRTLGTIDLRSADGCELISVLRQPKRLTLLVYLALPGPGRFCRRDIILAHFWPELDEARARRALRQAIRFLRRALGDGVVIERGREELGLDPARIWCDAVACAERLAHGDRVAGLALYAGDLLPGLFVADAAAELQDWLDAQRSGLRRRAAEAAAALSREPPRENPGEALAWARRAVDVAPDDEVILRRLLILLDAQGNRLGALRVYDDFAARLARDYDTEPASETRAIALRLRANDGPVRPSSGAENIPSGPVQITAEPASVSGRPPRRQAVLAAAAIVAAGIVAVALGFARRPLGIADPVVVVRPFGVGGADRELAYLREGMMDLLAAKLDQGGVRAAALRGGVVRRSERREVVGDVVGSSSHLVITASLLDSGDGRVLAQSSATGPVDSLIALADRLATDLVSFGGFPGLRPLAARPTSSLSALRAYLDGRALYRRGRYRDALASFQAALDRDSTFALSAMGALSAAIINDGAAWWRAIGQAWAHRERLSPRDRALLGAYAGPRFPARSTSIEMLQSWEAFVLAYPDQAEAWYELGDLYYHRGAALRQADARQRAAAAFRRAFALDSTFAAPLQHLVELAAAEDDTAGVRRYGALFFALDSAQDFRDYLVWRIALALDDSAGLVGARRRFALARTEDLNRIIGVMQLEGRGLVDAHQVLAALRTTVVTQGERDALDQSYRDLAINQGKPALALAHTGSWQNPAPEFYNTLIRDALLGDGDSVAAARAAAALAPRVARAMAQSTLSQVDARNILMVSFWRVQHGELGTIPAAIAKLRSLPSGAFGSTGGGAPGSPVDRAVGIALSTSVLDAMLAAARNEPNLGEVLARADSIEMTVLYPWNPVTLYDPILAQLRERAGDRTGALRLLRARYYAPSGSGIGYLATSLRAEARLARALGDREGAIRAYRHYLALRADPEPTRRADVDRARQELTALLAIESR